ncbi:hypothetical protein ID866_12911, partial [Astraeus odoratus]
MDEGRVVEQGFSSDLQKAGGKWERSVREVGAELADSQNEGSDGLPVYAEVADMLAEQDEQVREAETRGRHISLSLTVGGVRPVTMALGGWMMDIVAELTRTANNANVLPPPVLPTAVSATDRRVRRPSTITSPSKQAMIEDDDEFEQDKIALQRSGQQAAGRREEKRGRKAVVAPSHHIIQVSPSPPTKACHTSKGKAIQNETSAQEGRPTPSLLQTLCLIYPTIPSKPLLLTGLVACLISGAMTPIFSFLLSRLMFEVSADPSNASIINSYGGLVLGIASLDGILLGSKYFSMEISAIRWISRVRNAAYARVLGQDKSYFDSPSHSPPSLTQTLIKDADDART